MNTTFQNVTSPLTVSYRIQYSPQFRISVPGVNVSIKFYGFYAHTSAVRSELCDFASQLFRIYFQFQVLYQIYSVVLEHL
jgi:hypothetical protein